MEEETFLLFVYGTLRTEYGKVGERVQSDKVKGCLFDLGAFPGYYPFEPVDKEGNPVELFTIGEVLEVKTEFLPTLDRYEGVTDDPETSMYTRERITTEGGLECQIYQCHPGFASQGKLLPTGDWFDREVEDSPQGLTTIGTQKEPEEVEEEVEVSEATKEETATKV